MKKKSKKETVTSKLLLSKGELIRRISALEQENLKLKKQIASLYDYVNCLESKGD